MPFWTENFSTNFQTTAHPQKSSHYISVFRIFVGVFSTDLVPFLEGSQRTKSPPTSLLANEFPFWPKNFL